MSELLDAALAYAELGYRVFPCWLETKSPKTTNGFYDASDDPKLIKSWWSEWPEAPIGLRTGMPGGIFVVDIDPGAGGDDTLADLFKSYGEFPETPQVLTGGGGVHYWFRMPDVDLTVSGGALGPGIDTRGNSGYVIVPPSPHISGHTYIWEVTADLQDVPLADVPPWLIALLQEKKKEALPEASEPIPAGQRNATLTRVAGALRRPGLSQAALEAALMVENAARCKPPLDEKEVKIIARSVSRYTPAPASHVNGQVGASKKQELQLPPGTYGDVYNAQALALNYSDTLKYCHEWRSWHIWRGTHWGRDREQEVFDYARQILVDIGHHALEEEDDRLTKHVIRSRTHRNISSMIAHASTIKSIRQNPDDFDRYPWLFNCPNGVIDLETGKLHPHDRTQLMTKCAPVAYCPEAECPNWLQFLEQIMGDGNQGLITFLQRAVGYSLVGSTEEKVLFLPWGTGDNGKSTFIETIAEILGTDYALHTPPELLLSKEKNAIPNDVARLKGVRFAYASEPPQGRRLNSSLIKELTGGDTVSARFMRGEFFDFRPECTLWMSTNHRPPTRDTGHALWRRIKLIPFIVSIPKESQVRNLRQKLLAEAEGILAWAVRGCLDWQREGLAEPEEVTAATDEYRTENDSISIFMQEKCLISAQCETGSTELYNAFKGWADEAGEYIMSQKVFSQALIEKGFQLIKGRTRKFRGLGLFNVSL